MLSLDKRNLHNHWLFAYNLLLYICINYILSSIAFYSLTWIFLFILLEWLPNLRDFKWMIKWYCLKAKTNYFWWDSASLWRSLPGKLSNSSARFLLQKSSCFLELPSYPLIFREEWPKSLATVFRYIESVVLTDNNDYNNKLQRTCPCAWLCYTSRADSFWWRFEWKFFQSSFAVATLAWMPSAFSLVNRVLKSSPLDNIMLSLCCPFSLSDKNSYKEKG